MSGNETPKRRSLIAFSPKQKFTSPLASSTPKKQIVSDLNEEGGVDSETDSVTTILVSPRRNYRREVRLLRVRLEEIKLKIRQESSFLIGSGTCLDDKENLRGEQEKFFFGIQRDLLESCDQLLGQCRSQDQWARDQRIVIEQMYKVHLEELSSEVNDLRNENAKLRQKLALIDTKISEVLSENKYLRWESEQYTQANNSLQSQINQKSLKMTELQAEIHCLKDNQSEINRIHSLKLQTAIQDVRQEGKMNREKFQADYEVKLKEEQKRRLKDQEEFKSLKAMNENSPKAIEKLAENNRQLYVKLVENRQQLDEQAENFKNREFGLLNELDKLRHSTSSINKLNGSKSNSPEKSIRFGTVERISTDGRVFCQTIAEWEEKFGVLRREYELEREQRRNVTKLLIEMSRDMKSLLGKNRNDSTV